MGEFSSSASLTSASDAGRRQLLLAELDAAQARYEDAALAATSRRAYASSLRHFADWCHELDLLAYPAEAETVGSGAFGSGPNRCR